MDDYEHATTAKPQTDSICTMARLAPAMSCSSDCNFRAFTKHKPNVNATIGRQLNDTALFFRALIPSLAPRVQRTCLHTLGKDLPKPRNVTEMLGDLGAIHLIDQKALGALAASEAVLVAKGLAASGQMLEGGRARELGRRVAASANAAEMLTIVSSVPLECFRSTSADVLVSNFSSMDIQNMDKSRKVFIAKKVETFFLDGFSGGSIHENLEYQTCLRN